MKNDVYPLGVRVALLVMLLLGTWGVVISIGMGMFRFFRYFTPEQLVAIGGFSMCMLWVAYMRWLIGQYRKPRPAIKRWVDKTQAKTEKWYEGENRKKLLTMEQLERKTHDWRLDGRPGSVAAASIGLETIDEVFDGD